MTDTRLQRHPTRDDSFLRRLSGPEFLAFVPAVCLAGFWTMGERGLLAVAVAAPLAITGMRAILRRTAPSRSATASHGLPDRKQFLTTALCKAALPGAEPERWAAAAVEIDDWPSIADRLGEEAAERLARACASRIATCLRPEDLMTRIAPSRFAILIADGERSDLESMIHLSTRLQKRMIEPVTGGTRPLFATLSVGFCTPQRRPDREVDSLLSASEVALDDSLRNGSGGIRAFSAEMQRCMIRRARLAGDLPDAIRSGEIAAWFQPQISLADGSLSGTEVLARWQHPDMGVMTPADFLPLAEEMGLLPALGAAILAQALDALRGWDAAGLKVPGVAVNFTQTELADPAVVDRVGWELDRFGIAPERLTVEVLETVVSGAPDDIIARNLRALTAKGCRVDLDDFGTGQSSITTVRRLCISRLKIDRSFISDVDWIGERADVVSAVVTMTAKLGLDCLAEGVERTGELAALKDMGCGHAQGFLIARPMPGRDIPGWVAEWDRQSHIALATVTGDGAPEPRHGKTA